MSRMGCELSRRPGNPSIMGAILARQTNGKNIAVVQLGSTLPSTTPPTRIAEECAMLDCISGGRLVGRFPTGLPSDAVSWNGVIPVEQRERYREALSARHQTVVGEEDFRVERQILSTGNGQSWLRPIQHRIRRSGFPVLAQNQHRAAGGSTLDLFCDTAARVRALFGGKS